MAIYFSQKIVRVTWSINVKELYGHRREKFFALGLVFMTNANIDNENPWYMPQGPFANYCQLWKMAKSQKEKFR